MTTSFVAPRGARLASPTSHCACAAIAIGLGDLREILADGAAPPVDALPSLLERTHELGAMDLDRVGGEPFGDRDAARLERGSLRLEGLDERHEALRHGHVGDDDAAAMHPEAPDHRRPFGAGLGVGRFGLPVGILGPRRPGLEEHLALRDREDARLHERVLTAALSRRPGRQLACPQVLSRSLGEQARPAGAACGADDHECAASGHADLEDHDPLCAVRFLDDGAGKVVGH